VKQRSGRGNIKGKRDQAFGERKSFVVMEETGTLTLDQWGNENTEEGKLQIRGRQGGKHQVP